MNKSYYNKLGFLMAMILFISVLIHTPAVQAKTDDNTVDRHIIIMVDFTQSFIKNTHENCWHPIELITGCNENGEQKKKDCCGKIQPKDRIQIIKITDQSMRNVSMIADLYMKPQDMLTSDNQYRTMTIPKKLEFRDAIKASLTNPKLASKTEILSGIRAAKNMFDEVKAPVRILVILSDMIEDSEFYVFDKMKVNPKTILANESKNKRLPDLKGIKVYVSGASAANQKKYDEIQKFWEAYLTATGANFTSTQYSNRMSTF